MTTRTAEIRDALRPLLSLLSPTYRAHLDDLLELADIGARAQELMTSFAAGTPSAAKPARKPRAVPPAPTPKPTPKRKGAVAAKPRGKRGPKPKAEAKPAPAPAAPSSKTAPPPKAPTVPPPAAPAAASGSGPTLREAILKVLKDAKGPLGIADIAAAAKASGYATTSANFSVVVGNMVPKLKEVKRAGRGVYTLAE
jgi:hypothetical protein